MIEDELLVVLKKHLVCDNAFLFKIVSAIFDQAGASRVYDRGLKGFLVEANVGGGKTTLLKALMSEEAPFGGGDSVKFLDCAASSSSSSSSSSFA